ncbi:hypothetical protein GOP47_0026851 [Adiantum capillus-veneris]|nr:hypothetical protein GOP47_0026851 [Adiantum capillus-veneris]
MRYWSSSYLALQGTFGELSCGSGSAVGLSSSRNSQKNLSWQKINRRTFTNNLVTLISLAAGQDLSVSSAYAEDQPRSTQEEGLETIQMELRKVLKRPKAAGILRLVFHDAGTFNCIKHTGGMNGSIQFELGRPENSGLDRSIKILDLVKTSLDTTLQVSWADLIAVAGAEAVSICGGPKIPVKLGRLDASIADPEGELPEESFNASSLKGNFSKKGFMTREMVVLSGAHTLGSKGFGNPLVFDNAYFKVLLQKPWTQIGNEMGSMTGLPSDRSLLDDDECLRWINYYANDQAKFFEDFSSAYVKLVNSGVKWRTEVA